MVHRILVDTDILIDAGRVVEVAVTQLETTAQTLTHKHQLSPHDDIGGDLGFPHFGYTPEDGSIP